LEEVTNFAFTVAEEARFLTWWWLISHDAEVKHKEEEGGR
jgi:hypothetical protein